MGGEEGGVGGGEREKGQSHQQTAPLKGSLKGCGGVFLAHVLMF